jgi:hypothetical protein
MAAISISEASLSAIKKALRADFIDEKSSHLAEALAYSLGFQTNAALLKVVSLQAEDPPTLLLDTDRFVSRLQSFGYPRDDEFDFEYLGGAAGLIISTFPISAYEVSYETERHKAWRNLMVCVINQGLQRKIFALKPGDNRWDSSVSNNPEDRNSRHSDHGYFYDFTLPNGLPARGYVQALGWGGELKVGAAVHPKRYATSTSSFADFSAGDAWATSWLERETGAWLQSAKALFHCRKYLLSSLAAIDVEPLGYGDKG